MQVGIVAAFDREARMLAAQARTGCDSRAVGTTRIALAGVGPAGAQAAGQRLLKQGATALVSWGIAAALEPQLSPGSLLIPNSVIAADGRAYPVDSGWHHSLCERLANFAVHTGPLAESYTILGTPAQKNALASRTGAIGADMESAALAAVAHAGQVPFVAIRVVSDAADTKVPAWLAHAIDGAGRLSKAAVLKQIALHPAEWGAISRLALGFKAARATLSAVARQVDLDTLLAA